MKSLRLHLGLALAATVFATTASAQQPYGYDTGRNTGYNDRVLMRCESRDERTRYCAADIRGDVRLVNQLSRSRCTEGRSWGWDRRGIWVSGGCRAEFEIDQGSGYGYDDRRGSGYGQARVIRCESTNSRKVYCHIDTRYGVRLLTQHSRNACIEGRSWGWDSHGVWVSDGCRAQFQVGQRGQDNGDGHEHESGYGHGTGSGTGYGGGYGDTYGRRITCESRNNRYNFCRTSGYITRAEIVDRKSRDNCSFNYSWGYRNDGIWVDRGCRAEFVVY